MWSGPHGFIYRVLRSRLTAPSRSFRNSNKMEVGRISREDSAWLAKLLDHDMLLVTGYCVACPDKFRSGAPCLGLAPAVALSDS